VAEAAKPPAPPPFNPYKWITQPPAGSRLAARLQAPANSDAVLASDPLSNVPVAVADSNDMIRHQNEVSGAASDKAAAARLLIAKAEQMRTVANKMERGDGDLKPGAFADVRGAIGNAFLSGADALGIPPPRLDEHVSNLQELIKYTTQLGFDAARAGVGGKVAVAELNRAFSGIPNPDMRRTAMLSVINGMEAFAQRDIDYNEARQNWVRAMKGRPFSMDKFDNYNAKYNPTDMYWARAGSATYEDLHPGSMQLLQQHADNPAYRREYDTRLGIDGAADYVLGRY
jgi:hypothetical protein